LIAFSAPIEGKPEDVAKVVREYNQKLQKSNLPKLLTFGEPGALITKPVVDSCTSRFTADLVRGIVSRQINPSNEIENNIDLVRDRYSK
jgi:hypothetical protein